MCRVCVGSDTRVPPPGVSVGRLYGPSCEVLSRLTRYRNFKWMGLHEHACDQTAEISSNHTPDEGEREDGDEGKNGGLLL